MSNFTRTMCGSECDIATTMLSQALEENKAVQYYVNYVARLYKMLAVGSYGKAPDVAEPGSMLRAPGNRK